MAMRQIKPTDSYATITKVFLAEHGDTFDTRRSDVRWRRLGKLAKAGRL